MLFVICVYILRSRQRVGYKWHLASMTILFALSSAQIILAAVMGSQGLIPAYMSGRGTSLNVGVVWSLHDGSRLLDGKSALPNTSLAIILFSKYVVRIDDPPETATDTQRN